MEGVILVVPGGVFVQGSDLTIIGSSSFIGNSAGNGGGVYISHYSNVNISGNTKFLASGQDTHSKYNGNGGGIYIGLSSNGYINGNTIFISNLASGDYQFGNGNGGGIYLELFGNATISGNTTFISNSVEKNGAGD